MRKFLSVIAAFALVGILLAAQQPPPQPPKPGPEQKNLEWFVGTWKMEGTMHPSPMGPGGKFAGSETCNMLGGWHLVCDSSGSGPMGNIKGHAILTYDRTAKQYRYFSVSDLMPDAESATGERTANGWTWTSKMEMGPQTIHGRFTMTNKSDSAYDFKWEMSMDGTKWMTVMEGTSTRT
jgi:hypothetical protein